MCRAAAHAPNTGKKVTATATLVRLRGCGKGKHARRSQDPFGRAFVMEEDKVAETLAGTNVVSADGAPKLRARTSFGSILVGTLVAISLGLMFHVLGTAVGMTTIDAVDRDSPSATTLLLMAGGWSLVANVLAMGAGGYVAARLSGNIDRWDSALHGFGVWGLAVAISAAVAGFVAVSTATVAGNTLGSVIGGTMQGATAAATAAAPQADPNALAQQLRATLSGPADAQRMTTEQRGAEMAAIIARRVRDGGFAGGERERLATLISAEAGIPQAEAEQRIAAYEQQAREMAARAEERARQAADAAATATAIYSFWMFAALLIGAAAAVIGAVQGARDAAVVVGTRSYPLRRDPL